MRFKLSDAKLPVLAMVILFSGFSLAQTKEVNVSIDATKTGTPISWHIYGQFLEHGGDIVNSSGRRTRAHVRARNDHRAAVQRQHLLVSSGEMMS